MPVATVMVQDKWLPSGKKRWVIKASDGTLYGAMPNLADHIDKGKSYDLAFKVDNWAGKSYNVVEGVMPPTGAAPPVSAPTAPALSGAPTPNAERTEDIAVLAILKSLEPIRADSVSIAQALNACRQGWRIYKSGGLDDGP